MENNSHTHRLCCPHCGNTDLSPLTDRDIAGAAGAFAVGAAMGNPLMGIAGAASNLQNQTFWLCKKCGQKFRNPPELLNEYNSLRKRAIGLTIACAIFGVISLIVMIAMFNMDIGIVGAFFMIFLIVFIILPIIAFAKANKRKKAYDEIMAGINRFRK